MSVSWDHAYRACRPAAADLLRAVALLDLDLVTSPAVGVAADLSLAEVAGAWADLTRDGWVVAVGQSERHAVVEPARTWLAKNAINLTEPARAVRIIHRFAEYHTRCVEREPPEADHWLAGHRAEILAAIRACDRDGLRRLGARLALAVWSPAGRAPDRDWWPDLAGAGEALAIADRDPALLADLLHRSAVAYAGRGDRLNAEVQWVRGLAIIRHELHDADRATAEQRDRGEAILARLSTLYRGWGRLSQALDADLGLVELRRTAGDPLAHADALARVADTMRLAGRPASAADYLGQADQVLSPVTESGAEPEQIVAHARILERWGRALWDQDQPGAARRRWSRALALLIDVDDDRADHLRSLLATGP